jgi:hypothetical protein
MNEWEFTGTVASWINEILAANRELPFSRAAVEQTSTDSHQRRDLTLLDRAGKAVLTGEVKLPYQKDGGTPYNNAVVADAWGKARRAKVPLFFTWNVNQCVLWTRERAAPSREEYRSWKVTQVHRAGAMEHPAVHRDIQQWLVTFLQDVARVLDGAAEIGRRAPDERFIDRLEAALERPIALTLEELVARYVESRDRSILDRWRASTSTWRRRSSRRAPRRRRPSPTRTARAAGPPCGRTTWPPRYGSSFRPATPACFGGTIRT